MSMRSARNFVALLVQQFTSSFADSIYVNWLPLYLLQEHHMKYQEMGIVSSLPLIGGAMGGIAGGSLNDRLMRSRLGPRWARSSVGFAGKGVACALILAGLAFDEFPFLFCWILFVVKFFSDWSQPTVWGTVTDISGKAGATVFGINNAVGSLGSMTAPLVFGLVAKFYGWPAVFAIVGGTYLISAVAWLFVNCTLPILAEEN